MENLFLLLQTILPLPSLFLQACGQECSPLFKTALIYLKIAKLTYLTIIASKTNCHFFGKSQPSTPITKIAHFCAHTATPFVNAEL